MNPIRRLVGMFSMLAFAQQQGKPINNTPMPPMTNGLTSHQRSNLSSGYAKGGRIKADPVGLAKTRKLKSKQQRKSRQINRV